MATTRVQRDSDVHLRLTTQIMGEVEDGEYDREFAEWAWETKSSLELFEALMDAESRGEVDEGELASACREFVCVRGEAAPCFTTGREEAPPENRLRECFVRYLFADAYDTRQDELTGRWKHVQTWKAPLVLPALHGRNSWVVEFAKHLAEPPVPCPGVDDD